MKKSKKWLLILGFLLLLPPPLYLLWETNPLWQKYLQFKLPKLVTINEIFAWYLIIISIVVVISLIISLFIVLFWPTQTNFNLISRKSGQLKVSRKAINGFVAASLADLPYLNQPKVSSKLTRHRIKIKISGNLSPGDNVKEIFNQYLDQLAQDLHQLLGIDQKPKIKIKFTNFQAESTNSQERVQ